MPEVIAPQHFYPDTYTGVDQPALMSAEDQAIFSKTKELVLQDSQSHFPGLEMANQTEVPNLIIEDNEGFDEVGQIDYVGQHLKKPGFDIKSALSQLTGPSIEVAGPSPDGFPLFDQQIDSEMGRFTSNLTDGLVAKYGDEEYKIGKIDFRADAKQLPLKDKSVAVLFASCIPETGSLHQDALAEAARAIKEDGIIVWVGSPEDSELAEQFGLVAQEAYVENHILHDAKDDVDEQLSQRKAHIIFQKNLEPAIPQQG